MNIPILSTSWGIYALAVSEILLVVGMFLLARNTALLRDTGKPKVDHQLRPFSLARTQLALWTTAIVGSYIYVYMSSGKTSDIMNATALTLIGISVGTSSLSALPSKPSSGEKKGDVSKDETKGGAPDSATAAKELAVQPSVGFFEDILSDNQGMNIHRLQMLIWTLVYVGIFAYESCSTGRFPIFDTQSFVLMGISSTTYVWFKQTET